MDRHITVLGTLYIAFSALTLLFAAIVFIAVLGGGVLSGDRDAMAVTSIVATAIAGLLTVLALPGIVGGIGLLRRRQWARALVMILGFLNLLAVPFGTILGIYTIWVLLKPETELLFATQQSAVVPV